MRILLLAVVSVAGGVWTFRSGRRQVRGILRQGGRSGGALAWNLATTLVWYGYLLVFFVGLTVNNLFR